MATSRYFAPEEPTPNPSPVPPEVSNTSGSDLDSGVLLDANGAVLPKDIWRAYKQLAANRHDFSDPQQVAEAVRSTASVLGLETSVSTYKDLLLELLRPCALKEQLVGFVDTPAPPTQQSLVPIDAFMNNIERQDWDNHCDTITSEWNNLCETIGGLSLDQVVAKEMAKPSGPARSKQTYGWHYPTFTSPNSTYSHVMDPKSPSLWVQKAKIGLPADVKTLDFIPIRVNYDASNGPQWEKRFPNCSEIQQALNEHSSRLMRDDRFIVLVGGSTWNEFQTTIRDRDLTLKVLELQGLTGKMFDKSYRVYVGLDQQKQIQLVVTRVWHGQYAFRNSDEYRGAIWDLLWNASCDFAGVPVLDPTFFMWAAKHNMMCTSMTPGIARLRPTLYAVYQSLNREEQRRGSAFTADQVSPYFPTLIEKFPNLTERLQEAEEKGHAPLYIIKQVYCEIGLETKKKNAAKRAAEGPAPEEASPKKRAASKQKGAAVSATIRKDGQTLKWEALLQTHQVVQPEANRHNAQRTLEHSKALQRIDQLKELLEKGDSRRFKDCLSKMIVGYHAEKYPRGLRSLPAHGPDPYNSQGITHPAVFVQKAALIMNAGDRQEAAGPLEDQE